MIIGIGAVLASSANVDEDFFYMVFCGFFVFLIPLLSLMIRRIQDTGNSGWWILLMAIPYIGSFAMLVFAILPSEPRPNQYDRR